MATQKTVTLIDKQGGKVTVSSPADVTNLVYGLGYRVEGKLTPEAAAELLAEKGPVAEPQPTETKTAK